MKVCTDSCVFGSVIDPRNAESILDIGTGTGLLALMLAQRTTANTSIDGIELDEGAYLDAMENVTNSPWKEKITIHLGNINTWNHAAMYDAIICNPPFHIRSTPSANPKELAAFHADETLSFIDLTKAINRHAHDETQVWILLPIQEMNEFILIAEQQCLYMQESINIHHSSNEESIRTICRFSKTKQEEIIYQTFSYRTYPSGPYTDEFIQAMSPYYLFL
jgi:tRNA1Val (adenine37-N6)-methyltransferase